MRNLISAFALAALLVALQAPAQEFLWRTEDMTAEVRSDNQHLRSGLYLHIEQRLKPSESGWTEMKIDLPNNWTGVTVSISKGSIWLSLPNGSRFQLHKDNVGTLSFAILDGGPGKPDRVLEQLWVRYARTDG
jgi:hypothetical protein